MLFINEFGCEVNIDEAGIEQLKARGVWHLFKPSERKYVGKGPEKNICILFNGNGIGDAIHAMPAVWQKVQEGYDITVYMHPWASTCFTSLGCDVWKAEHSTLGFIPEHINTFGAF